MARIYERSWKHLFCGHWNGSPVEIGLPEERIKTIPPREQAHSHPYHEYYLVLEGSAELQVEGETMPLRAGSVVMVEPGERHEITWVEPEEGVRFVIIKERSEPDSKVVAEER